MKNKFLLSLIVVGTFALCYINLLLSWGFNINIYSLVFGKETWDNMRFAAQLFLINSYQFLVVVVVIKFALKSSPFEMLGLNKGFLEGLKISLLSTLPMFVGYFCITRSIHPEFTLDILFRDLISAGFFEEFIFRGLLFGILFLYAGWGFIPVTILTSLLFGAGHLYQANDIGTAISVFLVTALGSMGFSLFYLGWKSLWMPIFMHGFMGIAWDMFGVSENAAGDMYANIFRLISIGLAIFLTIKKCKAENNPLIKGKLWVNSRGTDPLAD